MSMESSSAFRKQIELQAKQLHLPENIRFSTYESADDRTPTIDTKPNVGDKVFKIDIQTVVDNAQEIICDDILMLQRYLMPPSIKIDYGSLPFRSANNFGRVELDLPSEMVAALYRNALHNFFNNPTLLVNGSANTQSPDNAYLPNNFGRFEFLSEGSNMFPPRSVSALYRIPNHEPPLSGDDNQSQSTEDNDQHTELPIVNTLLPLSNEHSSDQQLFDLRSIGRLIEESGRPFPPQYTEYNRGVGSLIGSEIVPSMSLREVCHHDGHIEIVPCYAPIRNHNSAIHRPNHTNEEVDAQQTDQSNTIAEYDLSQPSTYLSGEAIEYLATGSWIFGNEHHKHDCF